MGKETTTAHLTVDVVLIAEHPTGAHVLLIRRDWPPYEGRWALPGGYVDQGERFADAAERELQEETSLLAPWELTRLGIYDRPDRDPRGRVISVAFTALMPAMPTPTAGDDAREARWMPITEVLAATDFLAFDHHEIVQDALGFLRPELNGKDA